VASTQVAAQSELSAPSALPDSAQVWLVRHGETEWSRSGQHTGRSEIELTERGRAQAMSLRRVFASVRPALVLCSPRVRARQTAELAGLSIDQIDDDLAEWDYGDYEGLTSAEIRKQVPGWTVWTAPCPGGETVDQVMSRADRVIDRVRAQVGANPEGPVVLVAHGHISRVLGARWISLPATGGASLLLGTAATSVLGAEHGTPALTHWNLAPIEGDVS
jgi:broad specificity phosphatase PhoE